MTDIHLPAEACDLLKTAEALTYSGKPVWDGFEDEK